MAEASGKTSIQVIERMMDLLDALARNDGPVNLKRLANSTSLHPSTAHRIPNMMMVESRVVDRIYRALTGSVSASSNWAVW